MAAGVVSLNEQTGLPAQRARFSHFWLATVQLVLQADWQDVWHSPQAWPDRGFRLQAF
jgi:hypothetical protein